MAEVRLHQLEKTFPGGVTALRPTSLALPDRGTTVIVGPSGCGKTTLLRLIAGLETPTSGSISFDGETVDWLPPARRRVAMVTQEFALYPHLTLRRNMAFPLRMRGVPSREIEQRVSQAAATLGITGLLDRKPGSLSGGERQRAALGRVLVQSPRCALFDEPLSNLDGPRRTALRSELKTLLPLLSATNLYVTHDCEEAMALADRLVVMADGAVQQEGEPGEVYRTPRNRFVAQFITPGMSFLDGWIEAGGETLVFTDRRGFALSLPKATERRASMIGQPLTLGVRPAEVQLSDAAQGEEGSVRVVLLEALGDRSVVHVESAGGVRLATQIAGATPYRVGDSARIHIPPAAIRLFGPGPFGEAIM